MTITYLLQTIILNGLCLIAYGRPNFVIMFADDVGYGDFQSYGHPTQEAGAIDNLAAEGMRFTHWYAADSLCTPSRCALLTGRYPIRSGIVGRRRVFHVDSVGGLPKSEITIAEILKEHGYATGIVGKWHLGINEESPNDGKHLPNHHGFSYVGSLLPFAYHWICDETKYSIEEMSRKCFLYRGDVIVEQPINATTLSERIRDDAVQFIADNKDDPFLLYLPFPQTHSRVYCSPRFCQRSRRGRYGDSINEMAWIVGEVVEALKENGVDKNTLVFFLSDHGPQTSLCFEGGSPGIFKGGKATSWEGGIRVPSIAWWPGTIAPGRVNQAVTSTMDIYPTILDFAGVRSGSLHLDGKSIAKLLMEAEDGSSNRSLIHYCSDVIMAVRIGRYKIHYRTQPISSSDDCCDHGVPQYDKLEAFHCSLSSPHDPPLIFDTDVDPSEEYPLDPLRHRDLIDAASALVEEHRQSVQPVPSQLNETNPNVVPCCNPPRCHCNYSPTPKKDEL